MKMEFEGKLDAIIADMIGTLSMLGFRLMPKEDEPVKRAPSYAEAEAETGDRAEVVSFEEPKKRGRPKKTSEAVTEVREPVTEAPVTVADVQHLMEDDDVLNTAREDPDPTEELEGDPSYVNAAMDTVALHRLKEETLKQLRNLYISGKGPFVRQLLAKHGHGALVFPEVDAKYFPQIKEDMERGALN
jgi:hypothetical protein